ncbi:caldesmon isoform X3 [Hyperolius riggenbachi]|uniref:caldesmon isoform X3 n=1 Tax=Hyperolius riggenbachi TaxID=752182 RepID=UPI0035A29F27
MVRLGGSQSAWQTAGHGTGTGSCLGVQSAPHCPVLEDDTGPLHAVDEYLEEIVTSTQANMISRSYSRQHSLNALSKVTYERTDDDEEEAARERRRRARQERQKLRDDVDGNNVNSQNSVTIEETRTTSITNTDATGDDEAALLERLAKREERRQKRLKEAMERQKEYDPTISITTNESYSESKSTRNGESEVQENDTAPKENDSEPFRRKYEVEETDTVEKPTEDGSKEEEEEEEVHQVEVKEEVQEESPEEPLVEENQVKDEKARGGKEELKASWERKKGFPESKAQNGESLHEATPQKLKHADKFGGVKGQSSIDEPDAGNKVEAGKKLDELRRRRGETETGEFDKLKQKHQESAAELEELKKRREERKKHMEEEEQKKKQEEAERKAREEEEKKKMKEEIERRRAEAAEKRQKLPDEGLSEDKKAFKCFTPKGSSFKIEERAEFLNRSSQKSTKAAQPAVVSKIDSRLEQYTSAVGSNKSAKPTKAPPSDLPLPADGVRNIKSMWEKGNVFSSPGGVVSPNKETAGLKVGVSSRINEWLTKTPETNKTPSAKPADLRPGDVSGKRNLWEKQPADKPSSPTKMAVGGKKSDSNGLRFEKEP